MDINNLTIALILMPILGLAAGNYATSIIYRLPLGKIISNSPPYCDECHKKLKVRDLFPFFSWIINKGKCRYCGAKIPSIYALVEILSAIFFSILYLRHGIDEIFILSIIINIFILISIAIWATKQKIYSQIYFTIIAFCAIYRTLIDGGIFPFIKGFYLSGLIGIIIYYAILKITNKSFFKEILTPITIAGLIFGTSLKLFILFIVISAIIYPIIYLLLRILSTKEKISYFIYSTNFAIITIILFNL